MSETAKEKWINGVALTITALAVLTTVSALKSSLNLTGTGASHEAAYDRALAFQTESIKEHSFRLQMEIFELNKLLGRDSPEVQRFVEQKVKEYDEQIARFEADRSQLAQEFERTAKEQAEAGRQHKSLAMAVIILQAAILSSTLGAFTGRKIMWFSGLCIALAGIGYMANGFFLWF